MDAPDPRRRPPALVWTPYMLAMGVVWLIFAASWGVLWFLDGGTRDGVLALLFLALGTFAVSLQVRARRRERAR
ncbi:hypothetical protein C8046_01040 [Serinibacter arcticus]|uniref:Uncharacterized protein n=1 Tax=Serinibacter arcticus TaxID=1655435 RepID=A0A2U1ZR90_9MICO|nr:hypothetical protein [Serinibacter arcticus]PWD49515.1 hypothetical protein C8046_01040 [Serinibacter arcticus]